MKQVIAMHGWAGEPTQWRAWQRLFESERWQWTSGDRAYTQPAPAPLNWSASAEQRLVICHSLGFHLLPISVLSRTTDLVLLGGFSRFIPEGAAGRRQRIGLNGMHQAIGTEGEQTMLQRFRERVASPLPVSALPPDNLLRGLSVEGRARLRHDLTLLSTCMGLPKGCPTQMNVLVLHGDADAIVSIECHQQLLRDLEAHLEAPVQVNVLNACGHALITPVVLTTVLAWLHSR